MEPILAKLRGAGMVGILSHPERNQGILAKPSLLPNLVRQGCLMQITAGSLNGTFGPASQSMCESMLADGLVHFIASDGHGSRSRRPLLHSAFERAAEIAGEEVAERICCTNPIAVCEGREVEISKSKVRRPSFSWWSSRQAS